MTYKALVAIVGPSGSGKSTSLRNLDKTTTRFIDLERKGFPFRNQSEFHIDSAANLAELDAHIAAHLKDPTVKVIVIESLTKYFELLLRAMQSAYKGYDIYGQYNKTIGSFIDKLKNDHAVIIFTAIDEIVNIPNVDGTESAKRRIKVAGKQWEGMIEKEMLMVLFTDVRKTKEGKMEYFFQTNSDGVTSAKTPMEMFGEALITNDMAAVIRRAEEYYTVTQPPTVTQP